jgi:hypothetical protein
MSLFEQASLIVTPDAFKAGKLYTLKPDFDTSGALPVAYSLDVVRATTATRVNAEGLIESVANNVPRLDYTNGSCPSCLVEPQRTNLLTYSNDFANASWGKNQVNLVLESQLNPEGVNSTYKITNSVILGDSFIEKQNSNTVETYTTSVFIKNIGNLTTSELMAVHVGQGSVTSQMVYNWNTNTFTFGGTNAISASAIPFANGYVRLTFTYSIGATVVYHSNRLYANGDNTTLKSALIYGFQTEVGSYATSYIPTEATAVTRNADVISKTGISDLIGQSEGTVFLEINLPNANALGARTLFQIGTGSNRIYFSKDSDTQNILQLATQSTSGYNFINTLNQTNSIIKMAIAYKNGDNAFYLNGNLISSASETLNPTSLSEIIIGEQLFGNTDTKVKSAQLYKTRLTNAELANLTTL